MRAFEVSVNGKILDYRVGKTLDLRKIQHFLETKYEVIRLWQGGRHVLGIVKSDTKELFFKLATSEGISHLTKAEYAWNEQFNRQNPRSHSQFWVPQNVDSGLYENGLFYLITDNLEGQLLAEKPEKNNSAPIRKHLPAILEFSEQIQLLDMYISQRDDSNHQDLFWEKTQAWYEAIPLGVREKYAVGDLLTIVGSSYKKLQKRTRHGDFTPWHLLSLTNNTLGLIDGEHAMGSGVECYDIAYFIQRVFCVIESPDVAKELLSELHTRKYDFNKLKTVLAARAIGGYLDESLKERPNYELLNSFKDFVLIHSAH